jgi:LPS sulfotransferase NodH
VTGSQGGSATRFVIASFSRTGSTWLTLLLRSHPAILCHGEVFNLAGIKYDQRYLEHSMAAKEWTMDARDRDPAGFLAALFSDDLGHQAVGIKLLDWHHPELIAQLARDQDVHKVIVRRRNRVRAFLSHTRAKATCRWVNDSYDGMRVHIDPDELLAYVRRYDAFYEGMRTMARGTPIREVLYEDLLEDPQSARGVVAFLGVEPCDLPLHSKLPRQSNDVPRDAVVNFQELSLRLRGTALHAELTA